MTTYYDGQHTYEKRDDGTITKNGNIVDPKNYGYLPNAVGGTGDSAYDFSKLATVFNTDGDTMYQVGNATYDPASYQMFLQGKLNTSGGYSNPYGGMGANILQQLQQKLAQPQDYTQSPFYQPMMNLAKQNAETATRNTMEDTNRRGILNSTITSDRAAQVQQQAYNEITPQIISQAEQARQNELSNMYQLAGLYNNADNTAYDRAYQQQQDLYNQEYQKTQDTIAAQEKKINQAWDRVKNIGYVDNTAAAILGIPVGTLSYEAQSTKENLLQQLKIARENSARMLKQNREDNAAAMARLIQQQTPAVNTNLATGQATPASPGRTILNDHYSMFNNRGNVKPTQTPTKTAEVINASSFVNQARTQGKIDENTYAKILTEADNARANGYSEEEIIDSIREEYGL